jgi:proteic killer suppression protein
MKAGRCNVSCYTAEVIKSFRHRGIEKFFKTGSKAGIQPKHAQKLQLLLSVLNAATNPEQMNVPAWEWHSLKGDLAGHWAVKVNGNWRLTFTFEGTDAVLVDYQDYHQGFHHVLTDAQPSSSRHAGAGIYR